MLRGEVSMRIAASIRSFVLLAILALGVGCSAEGRGFMAACSVDADCDEGLECAPSSAVPESRYCTSSCSSSDFCRELFNESRAYCAAGAFRCRMRCDVSSDCAGDAVCDQICRVPL